MNLSAPLPDEECALLHRLRDSAELLVEIATSHENEFALQERLRKSWPADLVRASIQLSGLRIKARAKFSRADEMWFDATGLEQATSEPVAIHKARRFLDGIGGEASPMFDLCCGIGGDSLALAQVAAVVAVDKNPAQCLRTEWNSAAYQPSHIVESRCEDIEAIELPPNALVHIDPDRRPAGKRTRKLEACQPGLPFLQHLIERQLGGAIKLSPASNFGGKFPGCEIELVSWQGECREATVWFGNLKGNEPMRATRLPEGITLAGDPWSDAAELSEVRQFVFDPDPAVVRAGLLDRFATQQGLSRLDDAEEYLTADVNCDSPFVSAFEVLETVPNNERKMREAVRRQDWHEVEIKCRHLSINVDQVRRKLTLDGAGKGVLIYARVSGKATVILARRV